MRSMIVETQAVEETRDSVWAYPIRGFEEIADSS
jgi:hypothetical protein